MQISKLDEMFDVLKGMPKERLIAVWANDAQTIEAVSTAIDLELVAGTLVGDVNQINKVCEQLEIDVRKFRIIHVESAIEAGAKAISLVANGEGEILMKGLISTDKMMRALLNKEAGLFAPKSVLSHITVIENPEYHKLLVVGDCAILPAPDLKQKMKIANYLVSTAKSLGVEKPKLAILSASEQVLPSVESSIDACVLSKMGERGQIGDAIIDGPLSLDLAIDSKTVKTKKLKSEVAGDADCLLFPNLDAGNIFYKTNTKLCGAKLAAFVIGAKVPCVLSSRGDSTQVKLYSIALCALQSKFS